MNYSFFLFSKLFDIYHTADVPYDTLFLEVVDMYNGFLKWDRENNINKGRKISEYDAMSEYLANNNPIFYI